MRKKISFLLLCSLVISLICSGCGNKQENASSNSVQGETVKIGYYGGSCEAPVFVGYEKGFFKNNGLNVELVKVSGQTMKEGLSTGKLDVIMINPGDFKAIEQGLNIKITGGIHTGCIQAVAPVNSQIQKVADLKGKKVGVDSMGGVPMTLLSIELLKAGIDPKTDVQWVVYPGPQMELAMEKNEIVAYSSWDPFPEMTVAAGKGRVFFSNTETKPYSEQFCCYVGINSNVVSDKQDIAKAITKSFDDVSKWIAKNPKEAAEISVDKKYTSGDVELNASLLAKYKWFDDGEKAKESFKYYMKGMKDLNMLDSSTDVDALVNNTVVYLGENTKND